MLDTRRAECTRLVHINDFPRRRFNKLEAHHRFIVEDDTFARTQRRGRPGQVAEHDKRLTPHFLCLERDHIDYPAIGREERVQLMSQLLLIDLVVEVFDVKRRLRLCPGHYGGG
jgi:hypothetical protein